VSAFLFCLSVKGLAGRVPLQRSDAVA